MTKPHTRVPKRGDVVGVAGHIGTFKVIYVDPRKGVVSVELINQTSSTLNHDVPFTALVYDSKIKEPRHLTL